MPPITERTFRDLYAFPFRSGDATTTTEGYFAVIGGEGYFASPKLTPTTNQITDIVAEMRAAGIEGEVDEVGRIIGMNSDPPSVLMYTERRADNPEITRKTIANFQGIAGENVLFERRPREFKVIPQ